MKSFKCPVANCNKAYTEKGNMRTHMKKHVIL